MASEALVGAYGARNVAALLSSSPPTWQGGSAAFGAAPVWTSRDGLVVISGSVELDNRDSLRKRLELPGAEDGELLAELFACHGPDAGVHALGMFAAAVWDERRDALHLVRDGVGARTIYYSVQGAGCLFSTRLSRLRRCPGVSGELSLTALRNYLTCAFIPGDETMYREIREVRPGETVTFPGAVRRSYWEPAPSLSGVETQTLSGHAARLRSTLETAVQARLPEAGPVGVLLSGGLDSSVVTALAARLAPGRVHTFAVHFGAEYPNELEFSGMVARHCGTEHYIIELPGRTIRDTLLETMAALDDPIGDPLTTPNLILARAVKKVTDVTLNGEGGDPCFGGPKNLPMLLQELYGADESRESAYLRSFQKCYDDLPRLLTPAVQQELRGSPPQESMLAPYFSAERDMSYLDRLMLINVRMKGADQILTKVDNLFTAAGVKARSPLFDRRIVEAGFAIPPQFKLAGAEEKAVLKAAAADLLPEAILLRPKSGMLVPVQRWFRKELKGYARSILLGRRARIRPYLNQGLVKEWLGYEESAWPRQGVKLWLVLALEMWLRAHEG